MSLEYTQAANAVRAVLDGRAGLKSAIFEAGKGSRNLKRVYALTCESLRRAPALEAAAAGIAPAAAAVGGVVRRPGARKLPCCRELRGAAPAGSSRHLRISVSAAVVVHRKN